MQGVRGTGEQAGNAWDVERVRTVRAAMDLGGAFGSVFDPRWRRIAVLGAWGAGKTTLATRLGEVTGLPVVHLDALWWNDGWEPCEPGEWRRRHAEVIAHDAWILDGNLIDPGGLDDRLARADAAVLLAPARWVSTWRFARRAARIGVRPGRPDAFTLSELRGAWRWPTTKLPKLVSILERHSPPLPIVVLSRSRDVTAFVESAHRTGRT